MAEGFDQLTLEHRQAQIKGKTISILYPKGDIDVYNAINLKERIKEISLDKKQDLILDLSGVDYMDSSGIGVLVWAFKKTMELGCVMKLVKLTPQVKKLIELTYLHKLFFIYDDYEELKESYG